MTQPCHPEATASPRLVWAFFGRAGWRPQDLPPRVLAATLSAVAVAAAAFAGGEPRRASAVELEAELAEKPDIYLVLDPARGALEVRARGVVLDSLGVRDLALLGWGPLLGAAEVPRLELPAVLEVEKGAVDMTRKMVAPPALRPYTEDEEEPPSAGAAAGEARARRPQDAKETREEVPTPAAYQVALRNGWLLQVGEEIPSRRFGYRVREGVSALWARLRGKDDAKPPVVALAMAADDARKLLHLLDEGRAILFGSTGGQ